jgi:primosomal protein N' (replication factor Y)
MEHLLPTLCPLCKKKVSVFGLGTQRVEEEIARKFPDIKLVRMDSDSMHTASHYERALDAFRRGEVQMLVGTQMIAKGLDFPNVRLVGVISADTALNMPDFRAGERAFQLVCQVAGRSGRSEQGGWVIVQTFEPEHPAIVLASKHDYETFATEELETRTRVGLPPVTRMARVVVRDESHEKAAGEAKILAEIMRDTNEKLGLAAAIRGPAPAPIERIGGYFRVQIEVTAASATIIQKLIGAVRDAGMLRSDARTAVDVDPVSLL